MSEDIFPAIVVNQECRHSKNGEAKRTHRNPLFRDPLQILTDLAFLVFTLILIPIRNTFHYLLGRPKSLRGKVCLVTGSGRGLGREISIALAKEGAIVACTDINEENNNKTVEILQNLKANVKGYKLNVANKLEAEEVAAKIEKDLGPIYLLVNNAGIILPSSKPTEDYIRAVFNVNTLGPMWMCGAVLPSMKFRNEGHIVNISSISGLYGTPVLSVYGASKAALSNYSQSLRLELSFNPNNRIYVTCIHPDVINTSSDYVEMLTKRLAARDVHDVVRDIMSAIKYNKTDVSSPPFYYYLYALNVLFPNEVVHKFIKLMDLTFTVPNANEWNQLPVADIVRTCNTPPPCSTPEQEKLAASPESKGKQARKISFTTVISASTPEPSHPKEGRPMEQASQERELIPETTEKQEEEIPVQDVRSLPKKEEVSHDTQKVSHDTQEVSHDTQKVSHDTQKMSHDTQKVSHDTKKVSHDTQESSSFKQKEKDQTTFTVVNGNDKAI